MNRAVLRLIVAGCLSAALVPAVSASASTESLGLDRILAPPPTAEYAELGPSVSGLLEGPFDAPRYAAIGGEAGATKTLNTLHDDGFISGYGKAWIQDSTRRVMVEIVVAFTGGKGAAAWLNQSKEADQSDPTFQHALQIDGIESYYGVRMSDHTRYFADAFLFVKGNDGFLVSTISDSDSLGSSAADQTRIQYLRAPRYTIPPSGWPGAPRPLLSVENLKAWAVPATAGLLVATALVWVATLGLNIRRRRRRAPVAGP